MGKKKSEYQIVMCADFETTGEAQYNEEKETRVYLYHFRNLDETISNYGIKIEDFIKDLFQVLEEQNKKKILCYFHNLSFDGSFILPYFYKTYKYIDVDEDTKLQDGDFTCIVDDFKNIYQIRLKLDSKELEFRDSYRNIPTSIEELGKAFGLPKLNETHNYTEFKNYKSLEEVTEEEIKYITNDVRILVKAVNYMLKEGMGGLTFSSSAYNNLKMHNHTFFKEQLEKPKDDMINLIIDRSCKGGFTNYNPIYRNRIIEDVISFDYNSLYPAVMLEDEMPYGEPLLYENESEIEEHPNYRLRIYCLYVKEATCNYDSIPFIGTKKSIFGVAYDYSREIKDSIICLWEDEYKLFKYNYTGDWDITNIVAFKSRRFLFKKFLYDKIKTKEEASAELHHLDDIKDTMSEEEYIDKKAMQEMKKRVAKLYMNGVSGKFGMKDTRFSSYISGYNRDGSLEFSEKASTTQYYYRAIYSKITSGGRCRLISHIEENVDRVLYWDTDSIYLIGKEVPSSIQANCDDNRIGALKYEGHYKKMKVIKAKCYIKELDNGELVKSIAGATKEIKDKINFDNFKEGLEFKGVKHCLKRVKGGAIIKAVDFSIGYVEDNTDFTKLEDF